MGLGWKVLLPLALVNIFLTAMYDIRAIQLRYSERGDANERNDAKVLGVTLKTHDGQKVTYAYPDVPIEMPDRFRGIQYFDTGQMHCCNQCARICPTDCITLTGKANPDPEKKGKVIDTYDINFEICILCDLCTEVCPTEAIVMTNNFELAPIVGMICSKTCSG